MGKLIVYRHLFFFYVVFFFICRFLIYISKNMADEGLKKAFLNFANQGKSGATVQELDNKNWTKIAVSTTRPALPPTATSRSRNFAATRASTSLLTFSSSSSTSWLPNFTKERRQNDGHRPIHGRAQRKI